MQRNKLNNFASPCRRVPIASFAFAAACCTCEHGHTPARRGVNTHLHCNAASGLLLRAMHPSQLVYLQNKSTCCQARFQYLGCFPGSTTSQSHECLLPLSAQGLPGVAVLDHFCFPTIYSDNSNGFRPKTGSRQVVRSCSIPAAFGCRTSGM